MFLKFGSTFLIFRAVVSAQSTLPQSFYLGMRWEDNFTIIDVQPASSTDSRVRYIQIRPACESFDVDEEEFVFENISVPQLAANAAVCAPERQFLRVIQASSKRKPGRKTSPALAGEWTQGIAAQCGTETVVHHLPERDDLTIDARKQPGLSGLWDLSGELLDLFKSATGRNPFSRAADWREVRIREKDRLELAAVEIRNGNFDLVLPEVPSSWQKDGASRISDILPSPEEMSSVKEDAGEVDNLDQLGLKDHPDTILYPQMARIAHIEGEVKAELSIEPSTGKVLQVEALSGHPILRVSATDAIKKWVFIHPYFGRPLTVTVRYKVHCPLLVETTSYTVARSKRHHRRKKRK